MEKSATKMPLSDTQKGKMVETLIATTCILGSEGRISVYTPFVDDEGIDLLFTPKGGGSTILVQVKSRFTLNSGNYKTQIRKKSFMPRESLYIIFAFYDKKTAHLGDVLWLIPSLKFQEKLKNQSSKERCIFRSRFDSKKDMWKPFRLKLSDLPTRILELLRPTTEKQKKRAIAAAGCFRSGRADLSTRHDKYLSEAYRK